MYTQKIGYTYLHLEVGYNVRIPRIRLQRTYTQNSALTLSITRLWVQHTYTQNLSIERIPRI